MFVEFTSETIWFWAFLLLSFDYWFDNLNIFDLSDFLSIHKSVLTGCLFLEICPLLLSYTFCWCIITHSNLQLFCISAASQKLYVSVVMSPLCFWFYLFEFSLFFIDNLGKGFLTSFNFYTRSNGGLYTTFTLVWHSWLVYIFTYINKLYTFVCFCVTVQCPIVWTLRTPFSVSCKTCLVVINSSSFCLSFFFFFLRIAYQI